MRRIFRLSNRIRITIIGNADRLIFDDNTKVPKWVHELPPLDITTFDTVQETINGRTVSIDKYASINFSKWVINELEDAIDLYKSKEIDIIICGIDILPFVYAYLSERGVPIYHPVVFEKDEDGVSICKIDYFIEYNPFIQ